MWMMYASENNKDVLNKTKLKISRKVEITNMGEILMNSRNSNLQEILSLLSSR